MKIRNNWKNVAKAISHELKAIQSINCCLDGEKSVFHFPSFIGNDWKYFTNLNYKENQKANKVQTSSEKPIFNFQVQYKRYPIVAVCNTSALLFYSFFLKKNKI